jgi:hypothetical protein
MKMLRDLTSLPLEVGNVVHDVLEALLQRLQKSDSNIDEMRFFRYAEDKTREYFTHKTFMEVRYGRVASIDLGDVHGRVRCCLENFVGSPVYTWIFMKALRNKDNWMIEPPGYGETRLNGLKAYCKMDFLFPADGEVTILDWKTGRRDEAKHGRQLVAYVAATHNNFGVALERIFPKIVYLSPRFGELELRVDQGDLDAFFARVAQQTQEMYGYCRDVAQNVPLGLERFPMSPAESVCGHCNYQELCFPDRRPEARERAAGVALA